MCAVRRKARHRWFSSFAEPGLWRGRLRQLLTKIKLPPHIELPLGFL